MIKRFTDKRGYTVYADEESNTFVREHQLAALVENNPHGVFSPKTDIHHLVQFPQGAGVKLDLPNGVVPISRSEHQSLHGTDDRSSVPIELILDSRVMGGEDSKTSLQKEAEL